MKSTKSYAAQSSNTPLAPFEIQRRELGTNDVLIEILYCGVCHSDIHQVRNEWEDSNYPMVPGHEIVGRVSRVGAQVKRFKVGDFAGVGCFVDSCRACGSCKEGLEQYCEEGATLTYNSIDKDGKTYTYGGYSSQIVVDENYTLKIAQNVPLERVAPLLCAGITTYSPLKKWKVGKGHRVGVVGLGGLGHMGVKLAAAFGAEVTVLSTSVSKEKDAKDLGAHQFICTRNDNDLKKVRNHFDFILDTVSAPHDLNAYLKLLKRDGTLVLVGLPEKPLPIESFAIIPQRKALAGSMIGGVAETQEMLDFCTQNKIYADIELIPIQKINESYERMLRGDVKYRFVIDMASI